MARKKTATQGPKYDAFKHSEATSPMRPDVGTQASFKKKKPPVTYRYDSSLSPASTGTDRTRRASRARRSWPSSPSSSPPSARRWTQGHLR